METCLPCRRGRRFSCCPCGGFLSPVARILTGRPMPGGPTIRRKRAAGIRHIFDRNQGDAMLKEFKEFAMKGSVLDLAVGVIIGAAFGKIITSFTSDILMPPVGLLVGKIDFANIFINLSSTPVATIAEAKAKGV